MAQKKGIVVLSVGTNPLTLTNVGIVARHQTLS